MIRFILILQLVVYLLIAGVSFPAHARQHIRQLDVRRLATTKIDSLLYSPLIRKGSIALNPNFRPDLIMPVFSRSESQGEEEATLPIQIFIKTRDKDATRAAIEEKGGRIHIAAGDILTASVDPDKIIEIAERGEVLFIESAKPLHLKNDVAASEIGIDEVHSGINFPRDYTGEGVVVGVIDTGLDYRHPDFKDESGRSRILAIWDQNREGGEGPREIEGEYGTECDTRSIGSGSCPLLDVIGHGTHVAGTLAGRNDTYMGVAPDANIVVVSYDSTMDVGSGYAEPIFSTKICQAAYYVFAKAEGLGMPAVVNLSLGTHIGPHDGTSLFEQCLANLLAGSSGRAIVAAAGNEYSADPKYTGIHAGFDVDGVEAANFVIRQTTEDNIYYVDIWAAPGGNLAVGLAIHRGDPQGDPDEFSGLVDAGARRNGSFLDGSIGYSINATEDSSVLNGKQHVGVMIMLDRTITDPSRYSFDLVVSGSGPFDAWLYPDKPAKIIQFTKTFGSRGADWTYVPGDRKNSIAIPATSPDIIAVAGYTSRNRWDGGPGCCQVTYDLGDLLDFSSSGPSADPSFTGVKPELAAPGGMIASALSADALTNGLLVLPGGRHSLQAGTSMAAPFVSGTIALMFSANPDFTHRDAKRYLIESAYADDEVGSVPNDRWGYGKLDALRAMELAVAGGASGNFGANEGMASPSQNSNAAGAGVSSGAGCTLAPGASYDGCDTIAFELTILAMALVFLARKGLLSKRPLPK